MAGMETLLDEGFYVNEFTSPQGRQARFRMVYGLRLGRSLGRVIHLTVDTLLMIALNIVVCATGTYFRLDV